MSSKGNLFRPNYENLGLGSRDAAGKLVLNENGKAVRGFLLPWQIIAGAMTVVAVGAIIAAVSANRRSKMARQY